MLIMVGTMKVWVTRRACISAMKAPGSKPENRWMVAPVHSAGTICMPEACVTGPTLGDEVEVMVLEIDEDKRRISLGMKQCKANPWQEFAQNTKRGDRVKGPIKSITDFGVFVGHLLVALLRQDDGPRSLLQRAGANVGQLQAAAEK